MIQSNDSHKEVNSRATTFLRRMPAALLLSLFLHTLLLGMLVHCNSPLNSAEFTEVSRAPIPETQWVGKEALQARTGRAQRLAAPALHNFTLPQAGDFGSARPTTDRGGGGGGSDDAFAFGQGLDAQGEAAAFTFFHALRTRLDQGIGYPTDLSRQRITGRVRVELMLTRQGRFAGHIREIRSDQPILEAYVTVAILHALQTDLNAQNWLKPHQLPGVQEIPIAVDVDFRLFGPSQSPRTPRATQHKNDLVLLRDAYAEPWLNEQFEKLFTQYLPPVLPIPGGFFVDFPRLYLFIKNKVENKPTAEERREIRSQTERERWEHILRETVHKQ